MEISISGNLSLSTCALPEEAIKEFEEVISLAPTCGEPSEKLKDAKV
jgi:hypothetical protein